MVIQVVKVRIKTERLEEWLALIRLNAATTRAEAGCESYQVGEDLDDPNSFVIVEEWADIEAQLAHFRTPEFGQMMSRLSDFLAGPPAVAIHEVARTLTLDEALAQAGGTAGPS